MCFEQSYSVESLRKLHRKIKSADGLLDEKSDLSSVRNAWAEIVENTDRGQFFVYICGLVAISYMINRGPSKTSTMCNN